MVLTISEVIKKPRSDELIDRPVNFPPLKGLYLELLENKSKLNKHVDINAKSPVLSKDEIDKHQNYSEGEVSDSIGASSPAQSELALEDELGESLRPSEEGISEESMIGIMEDDSSDALVEEIGEKNESEEVESAEDHEEESEELSPEELEERKRKEINHKYFILKKKYPQAELPEFNEHSDLKTMEVAFENDEFTLSFDEGVEALRSYLISGFIFIEWICCTFIGIDMKNFAVFQGKQMHKYNGMLVELSDKRYPHWAKSLPVEIRLICFCTLQAGIFFLIKSITSKYGKYASTLFSAMAGIDINNIDVEEIPSEPQAKPRPTKMRGPKFSAEDIKNMYKQE